MKSIDEIEDQRDRDDHQNVRDSLVHAQPCLMEMDSSTFPASSM
jgi:hypothetical protein